MTRSYKIFSNPSLIFRLKLFLAIFIMLTHSHHPCSLSMTKIISNIISVTSEAKMKKRTKHNYPKSLKRLVTVFYYVVIIAVTS